MTQRVPVEHLESDWVIRSFVDQVRVNGMYELFKRLMDIIGGLMGSLVFLIVFPFSALAIVLESGFPLLYSQERLGKGGRVVKIHKFRSMWQNAEEDGEAKLATVNDPRVTKVGDFLRQTYGEQLARRDVCHISLGRIVPLDTKWRTDQWPDAPTGPMDPAYGESLNVAQEIFETVAAGRKIDGATVHGLVELLVQNVARSNAAFAQVLAVKQYENLTYCHSVNVALLSLLLGKQVGLDEATVGALVEAALLHDIGKTRVPLEIVKKPGALDRRERKLIEAHTTFGAEILVEIDGLRALTPTVALEHHRSARGGGYPDLGDGVIPHVMSQIVSVADVYEAITGARSYQNPAKPEQACLTSRGWPDDHACDFL